MKKFLFAVLQYENADFKEQHLSYDKPFIFLLAINLSERGISKDRGPMSFRKPAVIAYSMKINDTGKNKTAHLLLKQTVEISFSAQVTFQLIDSLA